MNAIFAQAAIIVGKIINKKLAEHAKKRTEEAERQALAIAQRKDQVDCAKNMAHKELREPESAHFLSVPDDSLPADIRPNLSSLLIGSPRQCSYCNTSLDGSLSVEPNVIWACIYKAPPPGARDLNIILKEGWAAEGCWQYDFAPCQKCGLVHDPLTGSL